MVSGISGESAELQKSGVRNNIVPKTGGNKLSGFLFVGGGNHSTQADNLTDSLKASGLTAVVGLQNNRQQLFHDFVEHLWRDRTCSACRDNFVTIIIPASGHFEIQAGIDTFDAIVHGAPIGHYETVKPPLGSQDFP